MWKNEKISYKKFIPETEEIRCWFKVTSNRKKVWNIQLWLLEELKRICKKHNIKYYADWWTLIWAVRHKWFIPWDDDIDIVMFRKDYDKFLKIAEKELPNHMKLWTYFGKFSKIVNENTAAIRDDYIGGMRIDIFAIDYASKFTVINKIKSKLLDFWFRILVLQKTNRSVNKVKRWKTPFVYIIKFIFALCKIDFSKTRQIREKISKNTLFKWKNIYTAAIPYRFLPESIYDNSHIVKFENTTICIADWYDLFLKTLYGDY